MNVQDLIDKLKTLPPTSPVMLKVYGMGQDGWYYLEETQVNDMTNDEGTRICEIDVQNS